MILALMLASMLISHGAQAQGPLHGGAPLQGDGLGWITTAQPGGTVFGAEISLEGRSLGYLCRASGPALVALEGLGGGASEMIFQVDGARVAAPFVTQDGVHYGPAEPGSALLEALMRGRQVTAVAGQITVSFPLEGSGAAIGQAMASCGLS